MRCTRRLETVAYLENAAKLTVAVEAIGQDLAFKGRDLNDSNRLLWRALHSDPYAQGATMRTTKP